MGRRTLVGIIALGLGLMVVFAGVAKAGEYHVYSCRTPSGQVAPTDGWSGSLGGVYDSDPNTCGSGGGLVAGLNSGVAHPADKDLTTWAFVAPAPDTIAAATMWRAGEAPGGADSNASYMFWLAGVASAGNNAQVFGECAAINGCPREGNAAAPLAEANRIVVPSSALGSPYLALTASCGSTISGYACPVGGSPGGYAAVVELFAADMVLEQSAGPSVSGVAGSLAQASTISGTSDVAFDASDAGAGVYEAVFAVDGAAVARKVLDDNLGRCRDVGETTDGLPAFLYTQPCPPSLSADVPFDTTQVPNGAHRLAVSVLDAAGNAAPVLERAVTVANAVPAGRGAGNGSDASDHATLTAAWRGRHATHLTTAYGSRSQIEGLLTDANAHPIANASIEASVDPAYQGAHAISLPSVHTDADGRWSMRLSSGSSSGALRFAYRSHVGDAQPVATRSLTVSVHARVDLRIAPLVSSVGKSIHFNGRLLGGPIPRDGKQLVLEARSAGGPWVEFHVIRTSAHGRFHSFYRFHFPGPVTYSFRVLSRYEADFPFLAGASNVVKVRER